MIISSFGSSKWCKDLDLLLKRPRLIILYTLIIIKTLNLSRFLFDDTVTVLTVDSASHPLLEQSSPPAHQVSRSWGPARLVFLTCRFSPDGGHCSHYTSPSHPSTTTQHAFYPKHGRLVSGSITKLCPIAVFVFELQYTTTVLCEFSVKL